MGNGLRFRVGLLSRAVGRHGIRVGGCGMIEVGRVLWCLSMSHGLGQRAAEVSGDNSSDVRGLEDVLIGNFLRYAVHRIKTMNTNMIARALSKDSGATHMASFDLPISVVPELPEPRSRSQLLPTPSSLIPAADWSDHM